ncbi:diguanylate cyclase (GGDEF) domain-containing protein [Mariprofundus ferrinatatus]|uniref:diguanylate cyclase n=1 Tax=Mariprofundus ferrinatatus TaxID=1921087 RepID=A0A2K8L1S1_9PROT|nr:GGDEF domain-containing protein [Mariprofundus ferrinatatus]ATX81193.1 diguanylate cyclase (GGDEF) domain-containing protein [Mariprofundus ferrinatatus]
MSDSGEARHSVVILGGGSGGMAILEMLLEEELVTVAGMVDSDSEAPGMVLAEEHGIPMFSSIELALEITQPYLAFNVTGSDEVQALASDVLGDGAVIGGMEAKLILRIINNMKEAREALRLQAIHDPLTGLYNRRHMMDAMLQGVSEAVRYQHDYAMVMIDLDHFKQVNDLHGHAAGDLVLVHMANVLRDYTRGADIPGRWGGEEFLVLLPHTDRAGAEEAAKLWLKQLNASPVHLDGGNEITAGFSAGVGALDGDLAAAPSTLVERLLHEADSRMYMAKKQGRNRVASTGDLPDSPQNGAD